MSLIILSVNLLSASLHPFIYPLPCSWKAQRDSLKHEPQVL